MSHYFVASSVSALCCAAWLEIARRIGKNDGTTSSHSLLMSHKSASLVRAISLLSIFLMGCGGSRSSPVLTTITVTSAQSSIPVSGTDLFTATAKDQHGNVLAGVSFAWSSSVPAVAGISASSGLATGLFPGMAQITASASGVTSGPATLTVTPGFLATGNMSIVRTDATATLLHNGMVLIAGGADSGVYLPEAELYDPTTGTFTLTGSLNTARVLHSATLLKNGMVLIAGGYNSSGFLASAEIYDPSTGTFAATGSLNTPRRLFPATLLQNGEVLVAGGAHTTNPEEPLASAELYDPVAGTFTPTGKLNVARRLTTGTLLDNGMVLFAGGVTTSNVTLASAELYDPATGAFTLTGSLNTARSYHAATILNNGMVLVAGGESTTNSLPMPLASAELYDPATGVFTATGSLNAARADPSVTLLTNGTVLFAGGTIYSESAGSVVDVPLSSAEIYSPTSGMFSVTGSLNSARVTQTATLLNNGTILIAGGLGPDGPVASAEIYLPGTPAP